MEIYFKNKAGNDEAVNQYIDDNCLIVNKWNDFTIISITSLDGLNRFMRNVADIIHKDNIISSFYPLDDDSFELKFTV